MSDNPGMSFHDAAVYGLEFSRWIEDVCEKLQLAGSIRRRRPVVHDIEMVVVPRLGPGTQMTVDGSYRRGKPVAQTHAVAAEQQRHIAQRETRSVNGTINSP